MLTSELSDFGDELSSMHSHFSVLLNSEWKEVLSVIYRHLSVFVDLSCSAVLSGAV